MTKPVNKTLIKTSAPNSFWRQNWQPASVIFLLALGLYISTLSFDYVLDDQIVFTKNAFAKEGFAGIFDIMTRESFVGHFGEQKNLVVGARYRPLSLVTFAIEYAFFGINAPVSHFINVLLYALLGLLIFRCLHLFFSSATSERWYRSLPFLMAILFIAHPIHTEVVANVKGRDELMTFLGALGALYCTFKYDSTKQKVFLFFSFCTFFLALLSKENALTFLAVIPMSLYCFRDTQLKSIMLSFIPLSLAAIFYLWIRYLAIGYFLSPNEMPITDIMNNPFYGLASGEKFATIFYTLGQYIKLLVFPHPLTHDYYPYQIPIIAWNDYRAIIPFIFYAFLFLIGVWGILKKRIVAYCVLFYLLTLSIVSNIPFTVGTFMNERFLFMPSLGFCILLVWFLFEWLRPNKLIIGASIFGLFLLGFIVKTFDRVPDWKNRMSLNISGATNSPNSARANCFLGTAIFEEEYRESTDAAQKQALIKEVAYFIDRALEIHPNYGSALIMHSGVVAEEYKYDRDLKKLLDAFYDILTKKSNIPFIEEYIAYLSNGRGDSQLLADFAYKTGYQFFWETQRDFPNAIKYLSYGLQSAPNDPILLKSMGNIHQLSGDNRKAATYFEKIKE